MVASSMERTPHPHVEAAYEQETQRLRDRLQTLAARAEASVRGAVRHMCMPESSSAGTVEQIRSEMRALEAEVDGLCVYLLVRWAPVGRDLREVLAALKLAPELERIGELAVNLLRCAATRGGREIPHELIDLGEAAVDEVALAVASIRDGDVEKARRLQERDSASNVWAQAALARLQRWGHERPDDFDDVLALTMLCRHLERIGDHAAVAARRVVYAVEGTVLPHLDEAPLVPETDQGLSSGTPAGTTTSR